jgi:WD40 repeat protein
VDIKGAIMIRVVLAVLPIFLFFGCSSEEERPVGDGVSTPQEERGERAMKLREDPQEDSRTEVLSPLEVSTKEAILQLDTGGHSALIKDILVTKSGDIISASNDKTVRVWDSRTGEEKRKILGEIGSGSEGKIYAIALSPDERFLAVGGYFENDEIRIHNFQTGELLQILKSHTDVVFDLAFSPDGKYLASGSGDKTAKIWVLKQVQHNREEWKLKTTISYHSDYVYGTVFVGDNLATASYDNRVALHSLSGEKLGSYSHSHKLQYIATNGEDIASCGFGKEILIFDRNLNFKKRIKSETQPTGLAYSPDGGKLISGTGNHPFQVEIWNSRKNYSKTASFQKHTNLTRGVNFLNNSTAISGGGDNNEIYIWNALSGEVERKIVGGGETVWSVFVKENLISWSNSDDCSGKSCASVDRYFDLEKMKIVQKAKSRDKKIPTTYGNLSLHHSQGGNYGYSDAVLEIRKDGKTISKITRGATDGYLHRTYGFWRDKIVSGGANGHLKIYNLDGEEIANLVGHTGEVWSIALDGDRLVSGSDDQTVRVWSLKEVQDEGKTFVDSSWFNKSWRDWIAKNHPDLNIDRKSDIPKLYRRLKDAGDSDYKKIVIAPAIAPQLSLLFTQNNNLVAWTPENFYTSSSGGKDLVGFHINQGSNREAVYLPASKLEAFNRPDLVAKALRGESLEAYAKRVNINRLLSDGLPPEIRIAKHHREGGTLHLKVEVCERDGSFNNLQFSLNGTPVQLLEERILRRKSSLKDGCRLISKSIQLTDGENRIGVVATNRAGTIESNRDSVTLSYSPPRIEKPNLYILAIGIDNYFDGDLKLNNSVADAEAILKTFPKVSKKLFKNIYTYKLLNNQVTKDGIERELKKIRDRVSKDDLFLFYIAGHGIADELSGEYFFIPYDFRYQNEDSVRESGISGRFFSDNFSKIQTTKSLILFDTCNSGALALNRGGFAMKTAIGKLTRATGRAMIVASSKDQVAKEGYRGHGVFTYALLEALNGDGFGGDNQITIRELSAYVEDKVPEITYKIWRDRQLPQAEMHGNDFPIGVK